MRDTLRLRSRIAMLAALAVAPACDSSAAPEPVPKASKGAHKDAKATPVRSDAKPVAGDDARLHAEAPPNGATEIDDRFAPLPGDPPYIDGYNPEEETCPSGNWCGTKAAAVAVGVIDPTDATLGCPARIGGMPRRGDEKPTAIKGAAYEGLSDKPNMQGALNEHGTQLRRDKGDDDVCCYHWFEYCSGRPHVGADGPVLAAVEEHPADRTWDGDVAPTVDGLPVDQRARLFALWAEDARAEHASIAAFARATLELMAVGAPAEILAECSRAALDEIEHARLCFALAGAYANRSLGPGALPALPPRASDLATLAADTFAEGCVGETIAALVAERSQRVCSDPAVRDILERIAIDESRHAALAWKTIAWAVATGGDAVRDAIRQRAEALRPRRDAALPDRDRDAQALAAAGRLDARALAQTSSDAWSEIIDPLLRSTLA